ncbi:MAG: TonB-dependent receptor [Prolixibacteraceae bacterium]
MHRVITIWAGMILFLLFSGFIIPAGTGVPAFLKGKITSESTGEALAGASIYFPGLKRGTLSSADGSFFMEKLPASPLLIQVGSLGYKTYTGTIDLSVTREINFVLKKSVTEIGEIVVTGQPDATEQKRTPVPVGIIPQTELFQTPSTNIIDAIAHVPGVSQITTGSGISKPVIRGLGYNRVLIMHQGVRQEGQQWGDEHGTEVDGFGVDHVEILKGPASLAYGSDAMAGVINLLPGPGAPEGAIRGNLTSNYQTNNGLIGYSVNLAGNKKGLVWDLRYSSKLAHAFENKYDGPVYNSGFREHAGGAMIGLNRAWGFSRLNLSVYHLKPGMTEGERDSLTGKFIRLVPGNDGEEQEIPAVSSDFNSYQPDVPFQKITHYKAVWNNRIYLGQSNLQTILGFQQNHRKEFESPDEYGLYFLLNTFNYDLKYTFPEIRNWNITTGINGMWQRSRNKGSEFLVPAYHLFDFGVFTIISKETGKFNFSGGLRFDRRSEDVDALFVNSQGEAVPPEEAGATERFTSLDKTFDGFSGSMGATWQISETFHTRANISRGFRAPNIAELSSNGEHEGTFRYERGNPALRPESSWQFDWGAGMDTEHISAELSLFHNTVDHYIYSHRLNGVSGSDSLDQGLPVFKYAAGKAQLKGGEFTIDIHPHPLDWLHFENTFSYTRGVLKNQPDSSRWLPMIPAARWTSVIRTDFERVNRLMSNAYLKFGVDYNFEQDHFYAAYGTETRTPAYTLLNVGAGTDFTSGGKTLFSLNISVNNLADVAYQNHLSRLKQAGINYRTGRSGIYNMGRNFSFMLRIPVGF